MDSSRSATSASETSEMTTILQWFMWVLDSVAWSMRGMESTLQVLVLISAIGHETSTQCHGHVMMFQNWPMDLAIWMASQTLGNLEIASLSLETGVWQHGTISVFQSPTRMAKQPRSLIGMGGDRMGPWLNWMHGAEVMVFLLAFLLGKVSFKLAPIALANLMEITLPFPTSVDGPPWSSATMDIPSTAPPRIMDFGIGASVLSRVSPTVIASYRLATSASVMWMAGISLQYIEMGKLCRFGEVMESCIQALVETGNVR